MMVGGKGHPQATLPPPEKRPGIHSRGGWVGPRTGVEECGKFRPHQNSIPGPSSKYGVALYRLSYRGPVSSALFSSLGFPT
jgi:hypothetical protein